MDFCTTKKFFGVRLGWTNGIYPAVDMGQGKFWLASKYFERNFG